MPAHSTGAPWTSPLRNPPTLEFLAACGIGHEEAYLRSLKAEGRHVAQIPDGPDLRQRVQATLDALRAGADVVYQAALMDGAWHGFADFLVRTETPSALGSWSYEAADTKLASSVSPRHVVQLSVYSDLLAKVQGLEPREMTLLLGDGTKEVLRPADFGSYVRLAARRLGDFAGNGVVPHTVPKPCGQCERCHWRDRCSE